MQGGMIAGTAPRKALIALIGPSWIAFVALIVALSEAMREGFKLQSRGVLSEIDIEDYVDLTWAIVAVLFVILILATVTVVQGLVRGNDRLLYSFARLILFFSAATIGWMGNDVDKWAAWNREVRREIDLGDDYAAAPAPSPAAWEDFDSSVFKKSEKLAGAVVAGFVLVFLTLFGLNGALAFVLSETDGNAAPANAEAGAEKYVQGIAGVGRPETIVEEPDVVQ